MELYFLFGYEVVFPNFIDVILWDDFRISFPTLDHSRVVYPSWDSPTTRKHIVILSGPETAGRKMLDIKALRRLWDY
jgi:hypothetical protein